MNDPNLIPNLIPNNVQHSPYDEALIYIYENTDRPTQFKLYQIVNVASVIKGIRTGALMFGIQPDRIPTVIELLERLGLRAKSFFYSKQSQDRNAPIILVINENVNENLLYYYNELPSTPPNQNNRANNENRNFQDLHIGIILGYFNPIPIHQNSRIPTGSIYISVTVRNDSDTYTLHIFPQKVRVVTDEIRSKLDTMAEQIRTIVLPLEYRIINVEPVITPPPPPPNYSGMSGGTRRRTRRKKLQRKKSQRKRSQRR
jgi:hypothetical protein